MSAPGSVLIVACAIAMLLGTDGWLVAKAAVICLPIIGYLVFAMVTVIWAIKVGEVGAH